MYDFTVRQQMMLQPFRRIVESQELSTWFDEPWFKEKHVIYLPVG
mgnify:CR=1 FL=1